MGKTSTGLVEYCKAQLGLPYWMGTTGQTSSEYLYKYNKERLPQYYTESNFPSQFGKRVHDCIGLIKGYLWSETPTSLPVYVSNGCPDHSADSMLMACTEKGTIDTIPDISGVLVFMPGHAGVYIGGGEVIEARGHKYGVVQTKLAGRGWKNWGKCPYIDYETIEEKEDDEMRYLKLSDIPNDNGFREIVGILMAAKILGGDGSDQTGNNDVIDLSHDMVRTLVMNYRGGCYDKKLIEIGMTPAANL